MWLCKYDLSKECDGKYKDCTDCILDKIRIEIKGKIIKRPWLNFEDMERDRNDAFLEVLDIIDKYMSESNHKCHNCKHYTSGERDGSCGSYICKNYSGWESEE